MATIAIDGRALVGPRAGIGWHTHHLIEALAALPSPHRFLILAHRPISDPPASGARNVTVRTAIAAPGLVWQQARLPAWLAGEKADLLHSTIGTLPLVLRVPAVATLHDWTPRTHAAAHTLRNRLATGALLLRSMRHASRIISVSRHARDEAVRRFGLPSGLIRVIGNGVDESFRPRRGRALLDAVRRRYAGGRPYFLYVGTLEPRKNLVRLIEAYTRFSARHPEGPCLVLAGARGWHVAPILDAAAKSPATRRIRFVDYVEARELPAVYSAAVALLYPSLVEGFGLPAAEAMACGTPVLAGDASSLPEVVGRAGLLVDPHSVGAITEGIERLFADAPLRRRLSRLGRARAKAFRWKDAARRTLAVYDEVLAERGPRRV